MSDKINVMIVEDQAMPRQLFEAIVKSQQKFNLAVSIDNAAIADICCARHAIDLVLMDVVTKNGASGLVAAEKIKAQNKKVKIIIVTSMPECSYVERAKKIGVEGFWYKDFSPEPILSLIGRVLNGEFVYPDDVPEVQLGLAKSGEITARELEILREMTGGFTNAEIAENSAFRKSGCAITLPICLKKRDSEAAPNLPCAQERRESSYLTERRTTFRKRKKLPSKTSVSPFKREEKEKTAVFCCALKSGRTFRFTAFFMPIFF